MQCAGKDGEREVDGRGDGALDDLVWFAHVDQVCVLVRGVGDGSLESSWITAPHQSGTQRPWLDIRVREYASVPVPLQVILSLSRQLEGLFARLGGVRSDKLVSCWSGKHRSDPSATDRRARRTQHDPSKHFLSC